MPDTGPYLAGKLLRLAAKIDHPDHYTDADTQERCRTCWTGLSHASWPCLNRDHAELIRATIRGWSDA